MKVEFGNDHAIEGYRENEHDREVKYRTLEGQRTTTMVIPDGIPLGEAFISCVGILPKHMEDGAKPVWIESDSPALQAMLQEHYGVTKKRPKTWGKKKASED